MATQLRSALARAVPPWMRPRPGLDRGFRYLYVFGLLADVSLEAGMQGILAKLPTQGTHTALPRLAKDRQLVRGFEEPGDPFAQRLTRWRPDHKRRGNPYTLMRQVRAYLYPHLPLMRVVNHRGTWYTLEPDDELVRDDAGNWDWDGKPDAEAWSRFWLIIYPPAELWVRDGTWGDGGEVWGETGKGTWGSTATPEQVSTIRHIVKEWKSAGAVCVSIVIAFDEAALDPSDAQPPLPDGSWAYHSKNEGGVQVAARDDRAIYWDGIAS